MNATVGYIGTQTIIKADIAEATSTMTDMTQRVGITVTEPADATFEMHDPFEGLRDLWVSIERSVLQIKKRLLGAHKYGEASESEMAQDKARSSQVS